MREDDFTAVLGPIRWQHDCGWCVYVYSKGAYDIWLHPGANPEIESIVVRFGPESDYFSVCIAELYRMLDGGAKVRIPGAGWEFGEALRVLNDDPRSALRNRRQPKNVDTPEVARLKEELRIVREMLAAHIYATGDGPKTDQKMGELIDWMVDLRRGPR